MDIYDHLGAKGYEIITCETYEDYQALRLLDGTPRKADWKPIEVKRVRPTKRAGFRPADLPFLGSALILRRSAVDALRDMLDAQSELLPLHDEGGVELYVVNMRTIDALDREHSVIQSYGEDGHISYVKKPVFTRSVLEGVHLFKQANVANPIYFSDRFVARVKAAKLKGLDFTKVWSSED